MNKCIQTALLFLISINLSQASDAVYTASAKGDFQKIYKQVYQSLENNRLFVVFEPDIGSNLSGFSKRWGENYNRNNLEQIKSMIFCNAWYANEVSNIDPRMTAMCPLHVTLTHKKGVTSVHFVKPSYVAKGTKAEAVAAELTQKVIKAINEGLGTSKGIK